MKPAPADGEVHWGTNPDRLHHVPARVARDTPYHYVELRASSPGRPTTTRRSRTGSPYRRRRSPSSRGNAVGTADYGLDDRRAVPLHDAAAAAGPATCSRSRCATTCTWARRPAGLVGGIPRIRASSRCPGCPPYPEVMLESLVHDAGDARCRLPARRGRHLGRGRAGRSEQGGAAAEAVRQVPARDYFVTRGNHDRAHVGDAWSTCRVGQWQGNDCFHDQFFPGDDPRYFTPRAQRPARHRDRHLRQAGRRRRPGRRSRPSSSRGSANSSRANAISRRSCSATIRSSCRSHRSRSRRATRSTPRRPTTILPDYAEKPRLFLHHAGTRTATSARSARSHRTSRCRRSPPARSTPAGSRCCGSTPAGTR